MNSNDPLLRISVNDTVLSPHELLYALKLQGGLRPLITGMLKDLAVTEAAAKEGIGVSDEELQNATNVFRTRNGLTKAADCNRWLEKNFLTAEDLAVRFERELLQRKLMEKVIDRQAIEKFFAENRKHFDRAVLSRIVVDSEDLAVELLSQIEEDGADFAELMHRHSLDKPGERSRPHNVERKQLPPPIEQAVFNAQAGDVAGPFAIDSKHHLVKVEEIHLGELDRTVASTIRNTLFGRWLNQQMQSPKIEVKMDQERDGGI